MVCAANVTSADWPTNLPERVDLPISQVCVLFDVDTPYSQQSTRTPDE